MTRRLYSRPNDASASAVNDQVDRYDTAVALAAVCRTTKLIPSPLDTFFMLLYTDSPGSHGAIHQFDI